MISIVGGVYRERCLHPNYYKIFGSAGRAAIAVASLECQVELYSYLDDESEEIFKSHAYHENFALHATKISRSVGFQYSHGLSVPKVDKPKESYPPITVKAENVIRFGMIEGDAIVESNYAVYDPQSSRAPGRFSENGSKANHLALVLNLYEAEAMCGGVSGNTAEDLAKQLEKSEQAEVVVIKMGPKGALVYSGGQSTIVPVFETESVWKIGSGDIFVAIFGHAWMEQKLSPSDSALIASKATAYYCENGETPRSRWLETYERKPLKLSEKFLGGNRPSVYLAGPFFSLAELWLVEETRNILIDMGMDVFSPYHDVGRGEAEEVVGPDLEGIKNCDLVFAIGDGLDSGTIFELGYALALTDRSRPIVLYVESEREEDLKMMQGTGCVICNDYVTAIYKAAWIAAGL